MVLGNISGPSDSPAIETIIDNNILISWIGLADDVKHNVFLMTISAHLMNTFPSGIEMAQSCGSSRAEFLMLWIDLADDIKHK